jgi:hypothetical protein
MKPGLAMFSALAVRASLGVLLAGTPACRDLSGFTTGTGNSYEGPIVVAPFVRAYVDAATVTDSGAVVTTQACLTLDADHLQDAPGALSTSDGMFRAVPMRTIPQVWQDPLSTLSFGEGRIKNLIYVASATQPFPDGAGRDVFVIVSLMQSGDVEVRLLRGAASLGDGGASAQDDHLFAVYDLKRKTTPCSY